MLILKFKRFNKEANFESLRGKIFFFLIRTGGSSGLFRVVSFFFFFTISIQFYPLSQPIYSIFS